MNKSLAGILKFLFTILIVSGCAYVGVILVTTAYDFGYRVFTESAVAAEPGEDVLVQIEDGMSDFALGKELEEKGLVRDGKLFALQLILSAYHNKLESGVYTLNTSMTPKEMIVSIANEIKAKKAAETENTESSQNPAPVNESGGESDEGTTGSDERTAEAEQ